MQKGIDYIGVTASYLCHDGKGNYLMNKRSAQCRDEQGRWDFGGGSVEFGDTVEETLKKELKEEYCVENYSSKFLGYTDSFRELEGKKYHWIHFVFLVEVDPKEVQNGEPHKFEEIGWFTLKNLPQPLHSNIPDELKQYWSQLPFNS